ncbi:hypothetical protein [Lacticaseibacillus porcinae]|uniref:hypothetical protein n=1 Tax=Lacticaseibacillus porcinae TaxID=1123687 RepID=UPI000F77F158|nr:hypothetical protein [Lacticaseibacillus porcinae]
MKFALFYTPKNLAAEIRAHGLVPEHNYVIANYRVRDGLKVYQSYRYKEISPDTGTTEKQHILVFTAKSLDVIELSRQAPVRHIPIETITNFGVIEDVEEEFVIDFKVNGLANSFGVRPFRGRMQFITDNLKTLQENHFLGWQA